MAVAKQYPYKIKLTRGDSLFASTFDIIYVTLIGTEGQSERTSLGNTGLHLMTNKTWTYTITTTSSLGKLLIVKLEKEKYLFLPEDEMFCSKVTVTTPKNDVVHFPCYRWISRGKVLELRSGKASKVFQDELPLLVDHRKQELESNQAQFHWNVFAEGLPHLNSVSELSALPAELTFSFSKELETTYTRESGMLELKMKGFADSTKVWEDFNTMKQVFWFRKTPLSEYVFEHWKEDELFGYQFLNGANPNVIQLCTTLPLNFAVTDQMVQPFLEKGSSLAMEMSKGNIFICDYKRLEGVPTRIVDSKPLPLTPALCLFYKNPEDKLLPIAIQLDQQPSEQNPIFLPSDSEYDWLLAKMFVRNADFTEHQISYHLLGTHFLAEVFAVATFRNLPTMHPLYKLLIPHFRFTLAVNTVILKPHFGTEDGLTNDTILALEGLTELLKRAHSEITYSSLCLPETITARGLQSIPNFYYRDDGLKLWDIIKSFVQRMVEHFYSSDNEVSKDSELQNWINEIFIHGFLENIQSGIPQTFDTVKDVIKFITMVIFTVSAQHCSVNMGQFDYCGWIPNSPPFLLKAPPTTKGSSNMNTVLETLPDIGSTVRGMASMWLQSKRSSDFIPIGSYPEKHFDEAEKYFDVTIQMVKHFQAELSYLSEAIDERNSTLVLPYNYLNPAEMENSVSL